MIHNAGLRETMAFIERESIFGVAYRDNSDRWECGSLECVFDSPGESA
jgi:hypothetical protein